MYAGLSKNEQMVLWGIVAFPDMSESELADKLDMPYSTLCSIRKRLQVNEYFRTINVPMLQRLNAEMLAVIYTFFNPAISVEERAKITTKTIEIFEELFYSVGETHKGFSVSLSGDYASIGSINDIRTETFAKAGLLELVHPKEVIFPFSISRVPRFFDFAPLLASVMNLPDAGYSEKNHFSNLKQVDLSPTEKKVMIGLVDFPDATDKSLASHLGKSRHTVSKSRMWLEEEGLVAKKRLPNLLKLGFKVMAFSHISFNPGKPLDDKLLSSDIIKNQSTMFLAARKFECVRLSMYMNYEDYRADYTRMVQSLKENNYLAEMPITAKYMIPSMVVMKDMVFGPIVKKTLNTS